MGLLLKDTKGKPAAKECALFAAAVVFTYGIWENYVEQLAVELAEKVSEDIKANKVPERIRKSFDKASAWELSIDPGWRRLWVQRVKVKAVGDDADKFGLNTAKAGQVGNLLEMAGVQNVFAGLSAAMVPNHLAGEASEVSEAVGPGAARTPAAARADPKPAIAALVDALGEIDPDLLDELARAVQARRKTRRGS